MNAEVGHIIFKVERRNNLLVLWDLQIFFISLVIKLQDILGMIFINFFMIQYNIFWISLLNREQLGVWLRNRFVFFFFRKGIPLKFYSFSFFLYVLNFALTVGFWLISSFICHVITNRFAFCTFLDAYTLYRRLTMLT